MESALAALARMDALALVQEDVAGHRSRLDAGRHWLGGGARAGYFYIEYPYNRKPVLVYRRRLDVFKLGPRDFSQPAFVLPE